MNRNIEIKARIMDVHTLQERARRLSKNLPHIILQEDTFFHSAKGRLKLRVFSSDSGKLIYYERDNIHGPRQSFYTLSRTTEPETLKKTLSSALGVRGVVKKKRTLYLVEQTRIHIDEVENLGYFVELEVVLRPEQTQEVGMAIAQDLMQQLGIREEDLINEAYIDLLEKGFNQA